MIRPEDEAMTVVEQADPGHAAPGHTVPGVGSRLAAARERMGWALPDVAATLRIREPHLRAIEAGHSAELPAPAYAIGFVRSYATLLGLDPDDMARRYRAELGGEHRNTDLQFPAPVPERGVPAGAVVVLGAVIAIGAYIGWYRLSGEQPAPEPVAAATDRLVTPAVVPPSAPSAAPTPATSAPPPGATAPTVTSSPMTPAPITASAQGSTPSGTTPSRTPASAATAPASAPLASPTPPSQVAAAAPDTAPAAVDTATALTPPTNPPSPPVAPVPAPAQASASAPAAGDEAGSPAVAVEDSRILLRARADSWIEVHDRKGHIFFSRILHSGETWPVPNQPEGAPQLLLTTGNAGGTEIVVDGTPAPPLGAAGKVRRDVPLDAALMAGGKPAAANAGPHSSNPAQ